MPRYFNGNTFILHSRELIVMTELKFFIDSLNNNLAAKIEIRFWKYIQD